MQQIVVRVPASTSNIGPGFDCLGIALRIYNEITIARAQAKLRHPLIVRDGAELFFATVRARPFAFSCSIAGEIPRARGLGSSASVRAGLVFGLNELAGKPLDRLSIFRLAAELEGHPDNVAPAIFGGFTVVRGEDVQRFKVAPHLTFVLLVPDLQINTAAARRILPSKISRIAAVENSANACAITAAFAAQHYDQLRGKFADHLHQPYRARLIPFLPRVIAAANAAGAYGAFLSGSGSTICAITSHRAREIAKAMQNGKHKKTIITTADNEGVQIRNSKFENRK